MSDTIAKVTPNDFFKVKKFNYGTSCAHESNTHTHTRRQTDREMDKAMAIGKIADLPKN